MEEKVKEEEYELVRVDLIEAGPELVRTRKVEEGIELLAENIKRVGLIHPLKVYRKEGKYRLLAGQRRLMAIKRLGWEKVPVTITSEPKDPIEGFKISVSENLSSLRYDLTKQDLVDAVERLFLRYDSVDAVAEELGIRRDEISDVLGLIRLEKEAPKVAEEVKKKKIDEPDIKWIDYGKITVDASRCADGTVDEQKALELLPEVRLLPKAAQRKRLVEFSKQHPEVSSEELLEEARKPPRITQLRVDISADLRERLRKASEAEDKDEDALVELALTEWLSRRGY